MTFNKIIHKQMLYLELAPEVTLRKRLYKNPWDWIQGLKAGVMKGEVTNQMQADSGV